MQVQKKAVPLHQFFMVLDLRLIKGWVKALTLFFMSLCEIEGRRMMDFASEYGYSSSEHSYNQESRRLYNANNNYFIWKIGKKLVPLHGLKFFVMKSRTEYMELLRSYFENTAKQYGVSRMGIFGSVARGEQGEQSDVDVAYEGKPDLLLRIRMKMDLEKLFGCNVDLVRLRKQLAGSFFEEEVTRDLMYV